VPTADGRDDEFERLWDHVLTAQAKPLIQPLGPIIPTSSSATSGPPPSSTSRRVLRVGTLIQRSTAINVWKLQALLEVPPPPPRRVHGVTWNRPTNPRRIVKSEEAWKVITELFGESFSDLRTNTRRTHHQVKKGNRATA